MSLLLFFSLVVFPLATANPLDMAPPVKINMQYTTRPLAIQPVFVSELDPFQHNASGFTMSLQWPCGLLRTQLTPGTTTPDLNTLTTFKNASNPTSLPTLFGALYQTPQNPAGQMACIDDHPQDLHFSSAVFAIATAVQRVASVHAMLYPHVSAPVLYETLCNVLLSDVHARVHALSAATLDIIATIPVLACMLLCGWCAVAVTLDLAKACLGGMIHIVCANPTTHAHCMLILMKLCMRMITSRLMVSLLVCMTILDYLPGALGAGKDHPNLFSQEFALPGMSRWDGIPFTDFRRIWWVALCAALGNVAQDSYTLLQTARNQDLGSPGNPGTPGQTAQSDNRNQRLFGSILNYIEATSWIYRYCTANFNNNGRGLFNFLYVQGHLPLTMEERTKLENEWTAATMYNSGINFTPDAVFKWSDYVCSLADRLNKSEHEKRVKYLAGFPATFDVMIVPERHSGAMGSYTHPANYPVHHPLSGTAHPLAGQPDIEATARGFYGEWSRMIREGHIKPIPKGSAYQIQHDDSDELDSAESSEQACMARERVSQRMICLTCGGIGHSSDVDGVGSCLTKRLGFKVSSSDLNSIKYPDGYTPPKRFSNPNPRPSARPRPRPYPPRSPNQFSNRWDDPPHRFSNRARSSEEVGTEPNTLSYDEAEDAMRMILNRMARPHDRRNPRPHDRRPRPSPRTRNTRARHVEEEKIDELDEQRDDQNEDEHDDQQDDTDEHARLAVTLESVEF